MAAKKTLNAKNLEELGAARLAELLIEISTGSAAAKRRLRLELAGAQSGAEVAAEVRKRLTTIRRARTFVNWKNRKALVVDLEVQRRAILEQVAKVDPDEALPLMWRFLGLANSVFERCDDSSGTVISIFHGAVADLAAIAGMTKIEPKQLADTAYDALQENQYGQYDQLIPALAPVLGKPGLQQLKSQFVALSKIRLPKPAAADRVPLAWATTGPIYQDEIDTRSRDSTVRRALMQIADALGDVDGFIAQYDEETRKVPRVAAEIARRLLAAGRVEEALGVLDQAERRDSAWPEFDWDDARIAVLEAQGRQQDAQDMRWACFERALSSSHLRDYLKRLPDFDDIDAEARAFEHVRGHPSVINVIGFCVSWPALDRASELVLERAAELDGDHYEYLTPAADALSAKYPLAASLRCRTFR